MTSILFNGNTVADGAAVQDVFVNQMPRARYEVQSFDCQIINSNYVPPEATPSAPTPTTARQASAAAARKMTLLLLVSGSVRFGEDRDSRDPMADRGFSETFILIPNPQYESGPRGKAKKQFLIQSQNYRLVV